MTSIEWTDATWNPVRGCSRVSAECDNCYAMRIAHRFSGPGKPYEGLTTIRNGKVDWAGIARFIPEALAQPFHWHEPRKVFVNSMSDLFHHSVTDEQIAAVFGVMAATPRHTYQILTKRPERAAEWLEAFDGDYMGAAGAADEVLLVTASSGKQAGALAAKLYGHFDDELGESCLPWPLPNVWLGVSVGERAAIPRIDVLRGIDVAVRFVSFEPLLEDLGALELSGIHWAIPGGESGNGARPCNVEWIRSIVGQCKAAGTGVFVKQLGARVVVPGAEDVSTGGWDTYLREQDDLPDDAEREVRLLNRKGGDMDGWPYDLRVREFPRGSR